MVRAMFLVIIVHLQVLAVYGQTIISTTFVFHKSAVPWQTASNYCHDLDPRGRLVTVDTMTKSDLLEQLWNRDPWDSYNTDSYWIGLHLNPREEYTWSGVCSKAEKWTNWIEPSLNTSDARCVRAGTNQSVWTLHNCTDPAPFICEIPTGDSCLYDRVSLVEAPRLTDFPDKKIFVIREFMNNSMCDVQCNTAVNNDLECWLWRMDGPDCLMYLSNSTIFLDNTPNSTIDIFVKVCSNALVSVDPITVKPGEESDNPDECPVSSTTTFTQESLTKTTGISSTDNSMSVTSTPSVSIVGVTTSSTVGTRSTVGRTPTIPTTTFDTTFPEQPNTLQANANSVQDGSIQQSSSSSPATTTAKKKRVIAAVCECFCESNTVSIPAPTLSPQEKKEFVITIVKSLTINKSEISAVRRKFISVRDSRPSARNVGILGIVLLSIVFGSILIMDIQGIVRDLKIMFSNLRSGLGFARTSQNYHLPKEESLGIPDKAG